MVISNTPIRQGLTVSGDVGVRPQSLLFKVDLDQHQLTVIAQYFSFDLWFYRFPIVSGGL